jgi:hypothetical protein
LVEKPGVEPGTSILQGSTAARRLPHLPDREIIRRMRASSDKCFPSGNARYMLPHVAANGGARDSNRTNLFCSSCRRVDHDHYTGAFGAAGGKSNPSSPRWQRGALPLSYGREIGGQGPSRMATDYAGRLQRLGLANAQPARDWLRERDSNTRFVGMSHVRGLVTAPSSRVKGARL